MSKRFFRGWALKPFLELIQNRLPILCCEIIIKNLMNEDLCHICLAAESPIHKDNIQKCNSERPVRARKAPKRLQIEWHGLFVKAQTALCMSSMKEFFNLQLENKGAQARSVKVDAKEQLKKFVDRLEAKVKPALTETYHEVEQIKSDMENATKEAFKFCNYREQDATISIQPIKSDIVKTLAEKMKLDRDDEFNCEMKMLSEMFEYGSIMSTLTKCIEDNSTKSLEPVIEALKELDRKVFLIDYNIERAKKCADDATSTPSSATKCLNERLWINEIVMSSDDVSDESIHGDGNDQNQKLQEFERLRENIAWESQRKRRKFIRRLWPVIENWNTGLPELRNVFRREEMDRLLQDAVYCMGGKQNSRQGVRFIEFVARAGYRDEPELAVDGEPVSRRTTALHRASLRRFPNKIVVLRELFKIYDRLDVDYTDKFGRTHFYVACKHGLVDIVEQFLELGQDANYLGPRTRDSPLHLALVHENRQMVRLLLRRGADPNLASRAGSTPLHIICVTMNYDDDFRDEFFAIVENELGLAVELDAVVDRGCNTILHAALFRGRIDSFEFLLSRGAYVNAANGYGYTALHLICNGDCDQVELLRRLFELGRQHHRVQIDARDRFGNTPLHLAARSHHRRSIELLLRRGADPSLVNEAGWTLLHQVCWWHRDDVELLEWLLELGDEEQRAVLRVNARTTDESRNTALHMVLRCGRSDNRRMAELLLRAGADPNLANAKGATPLHVIGESSYNRNNNLARLFFDVNDESRRTVRIDARDEMGNTPLHLALRHMRDGHEEMVELLLRRGADPNAANADGSTPLHVICQSDENSSLLRSFLNVNDELEKTVQIDIRDNEGNRPLHLAVRSTSDGYKETVELLLRRGADPDAANAVGSTPLHFICKRDCDDDDLVEFFCEINEKINDRAVRIDARDERGRTPLEEAMANTLPRAVEFLLNQGAHLSGFVFRPLFHLSTLSYFDQELVPRSNEKCHNFKLRLTAGTMMVLERLEDVGYELDRGDALKIMAFFSRHGLLLPDNSEEDNWYDDKRFEYDAKRIVVKPSLSLYDLTRLPAREADKRLTFADYFELAQSEKLNRLRQRHLDLCARHLCEKLSRRFFWSWALYPFMELIHWRLPILCCDKIMEILMNEDLWRVCLTATEQNSHQKIVHECQKDYACDKCEKKFGQKPHLLDHQKTVHEGRKDFACDKCDAKYGLKHQLLRHQKIVHECQKDYACDKCKNKFSQKSHLLYHQKTVHEGRKSFACNKCEKKEIDWLLTEFAQSDVYNYSYNYEGKRFIEFVRRTGYKDEPDLGEDGKPILRRTTPLHRVHSYALELFEIYDRFDVNYIDDLYGLTHFHAACKSDCNEAVVKFLELGQDPNLLVSVTGEAPLHLTAQFDNLEVFGTLLRSGADPNLVNAEGSTPLHVLAQRHLDDNLVDLFFKICDEKNYLVPLDPLDNRGRTPLQIAVSNFLPHVVGVLLDRGADLSKFVFPADFRSEPWAYEIWNDFRLRLASGALGVVQHLEKRGYKLNRSEALIIMKFFAKYKMLEKSTDIEKNWYDDEEFRNAAKRKSIIPRTSFIQEFGDGDELTREAKKTSEPTQRYLSLDDLIRLRPEEAEKRLTFEDYVKTVHEGRKDYKCDKCEKKFGWKSTLLSHQKTIHHQKTVHEGRKDYGCNKCGKKFGLQTDLFKHQRTIHEGRKDYACDKCEKKFGHKQNLRTHQKTVHEGHKDYACDKCENKFSQKIALLYHQQTVHDGRKDYACDKCGKKFSQKPNLLVHQRTVHEGRKDYECDSCEKTFGQKMPLIRHQKTVHEDRKDYACEKCGKKFGMKSNLLTHIRAIHDGRKDYACDKCDKKFGQKSHLLTHIKTVHESRRDHACDKCEQKFRQKQHLRVHQKTVHGPIDIDDSGSSETRARCGRGSSSSRISMGQALEKMSLARRSSRRRSTMSLIDVQEGVVLSSRRQSSQMTPSPPPRINVISPSGGSPSPTACTPSPVRSQQRDRNDSTSSTTSILASANSAGSAGKDSGEMNPYRLTQRIVEDNFRHESLYDTPTSGNGGGNRRGSFLNLTDSARRRLSNVGDAVSRKISCTIGWKSSSIETIVQQGVALCKYYVRNRLKRSGLLTRKIGLRRTTSSKLVVESNHTAAAAAGNGHSASMMWAAHQMFPELAALGAELEKMYPELYERVGRQIGCVQFTSKQRVGDALGDIVRELMQRHGGCNWSKIVAIYAVAGGLACDCVRQGNPDFLDAIYEAMENVIEEYIAPWILIRGGWSGLDRETVFSVISFLLLFFLLLLL
ncbi:unnamed protein product [Trichogramma brassicae]|uniref:C2H2-type domain-containing protein n=1 Tax=Trichogramma brassicae TaxID=86971 RepID=A0A6H5IDX7_9HYME|nr:unnamed protein product [Trichogramma brassicae]